MTTPGRLTVVRPLASLVYALGDASADVPDLTRPDQTFEISLCDFVHAPQSVAREAAK